MIKKGLFLKNQREYWRTSLPMDTISVPGLGTRLQEENLGKNSVFFLSKCAVTGNKTAAQFSTNSALKQPRPYFLA